MVDIAKPTELKICLTLGINGQLTENRCKNPADSKHIATHAILTMGKHLTCAQAQIKDGVLKIDHTFQAIGKDTYEDELELYSKPTTHEMRLAGLNYTDANDFTLSDHVILWLYRVRDENTNTLSQKRRWNTMPGEDPTLQTYFIGSVA